jgi:hypothetical protein
MSNLSAAFSISYPLRSRAQLRVLAFIESLFRAIADLAFFQSMWYRGPHLSKSAEGPPPTLFAGVVGPAIASVSPFTRRRLAAEAFATTLAVVGIVWLAWVALCLLEQRW